MSVQGVVNGIVRANRETVEAHNASAHVGGVVIEVDALGFADVGTLAALDAEVGVDVDVESRPQGYGAEQCAYGAECVAQNAPSFVAYEGYAEERDDADDG